MASTTQSSGALVPASASLILGKMTVNAVVIGPGATLTIFDNTAASGKVAFNYINAGTSSVSVVFNEALRLDLGLAYTVAVADCFIYFGA